MLFAGILQVSCDGLLTLFLMFLLWAKVEVIIKLKTKTDQQGDMKRNCSLTSMEAGLMTWIALAKEDDIAVS